MKYEIYLYKNAPEILLWNKFFLEKKKEFVGEVYFGGP